MVAMGNISSLTCMRIAFLILVIYPTGYDGAGNIRACISSAIRVGEAGNGSTPISCFYCDPARESCSKGCQSKIKDLYYDCDGVSLPDGYYYDDNSGMFIMLKFPFYFFLTNNILHSVNK
jgi:hypothetical protein